MIDPRQLVVLETLTRDLDLLVFDLELSPPRTVDALTEERRTVRRKLDALRQRLEDLVHDIS